MKNFTLLLIAVLNLSIAYGHNPHRRAIQALAALPTDPPKKANERSGPNPVPVLYPEYDSILYWNLDTTTQQWVYSFRQVDMVYDTSGNLIEYVFHNHHRRQ
jgi:hypothetical protein